MEDYLRTIRIWIHYLNGDKKGTVPDFGLQKPNDTTTTLLEITTNRRNGTDPKERQRIVMQLAQVPNVRFVVLYRNNLRNIMRKHPEVNFFRTKRIKKA